MKEKGRLGRLKAKELWWSVLWLILNIGKRASFQCEAERLSLVTKGFAHNLAFTGKRSFRKSSFRRSLLQCASFRVSTTMPCTF